MTIAQFRTSAIVRCDECGCTVRRGREKVVDHVQATDATGTFPLCQPCYNRHRDYFCFGPETED